MGDAMATCIMKTRSETSLDISSSIVSNVKTRASGNAVFNFALAAFFKLAGSSLTFASSQAKPFGSSAHGIKYPAPEQVMPAS